MTSRRFEIVQPPNKLRQKTGGGGGITEEEAVKRGEEAIAALGDRFIMWANDVLANCESDLAQIAKGGAEGAEGARALFSRAHNLKGDGGTFGYALVTEIGALLSEYLITLDGAPADAPRVPRQDICRMHIEALRRVLNENIRGAGGPIERAVIDGLDKAVTKALGDVGVARQAGLAAAGGG